MASKLIIEIFEEAEKAANPVAVLEANRNIYLDQFIDIMKLGVDWDLPETDPPYKKDKDLPLDSAPTSIYNVIRRFYLFNKKTQVTKIKRESIFIQMLEGLHHTEAQLILDLKNGVIPQKYPRLWKAVGGKPGVPPAVDAVVEQDAVVAEEAKPKKETVKRSWYNNGEKSKLFVPGEEPEGWMPGRVKP